MISLLIEPLSPDNQKARIAPSHSLFDNSILAHLEVK